MVDQKRSLKHLPQTGGLYSEPTALAGASAKGDDHAFTEENVLWEPDQVEVIKQEQCVKPEYQQHLDNACQPPDNAKPYDFTNTVETWSDFMYSRYHPRSMNILNSLKDTTDESSFDCFPAGTQLWRNENLEDELGDKVRQYIEECNNCQGFQILFDCSDGYAGLTAKCLEYLEDEYSKTSLVVPIFSPKLEKFKNVDKAMSDSMRVVNIALAYNTVIQHSSLVLPLSTMARAWRANDNPRLFPHFSYQPENLYESSAILASYLDSISLRYRLKDNIDSCNLSGFCSDLSNYGRKLAAAGMALPFKINKDQDLIDCLDQHDGNLFTQLSPNTEVGTSRVVQSLIARGITRLKSTEPKIAQRQMKMAAYQCSSVSEMFQLYLQCSNYNSLAHVAAIPKGMPTMIPYPINCFDRQLTSAGFYNEFVVDASEKRPVVRSAPILATAQSSGDISETLESLHREASRIKIAKLYRFKETGFEADEYLEVLNSLLEFKDNYEDNFEL